MAGLRDVGVEGRAARLNEARLVRVENENTSGAIGWCLDVHDLAISKLAAGRERDVEFVEVLAREGLVDRATLHERLTAIAPAEGQRAVLRARLERLPFS